MLTDEQRQAIVAVIVNAPKGDPVPVHKAARLMARLATLEGRDDLLKYTLALLQADVPVDSLIRAADNLGIVSEKQVFAG